MFYYSHSYCCHLFLLFLLSSFFFFFFMFFFLLISLPLPFSFFFFFNDPATPEIYPLSLHDALPICSLICRCSFLAGRWPSAGRISPSESSGRIVWKTCLRLAWARRMRPACSISHRSCRLPCPDRRSRCFSTFFQARPARSAVKRSSLCQRSVRI